MYQKPIFKKNINYGHAVSSNSSNPEFHFHDHYEIYLFLGGNVNIFVNELDYSLERGDLLFFNSTDIHKAANHSGIPYERYCVHFNPNFISSYSTERTDLLSCFHHSVSKKLHLSENEIIQIVSQLENMITMQKHSDYGFDVLLTNTLISLLVKINILSQKQALIPPQSSVITKLLTYINQHIQEELSLDLLADTCCIDKCYLCKLFKSSTGSTIWQYIVTKRIALSKQLLAQRLSIQEVCFSSGFNNYAHFSRTFKTIVGMSAREYQKNILSSTSTNNHI